MIVYASGFRFLKPNSLNPVLDDFYSSLFLLLGNPKIFIFHNTDTESEHRISDFGILLQLVL